MGKRAAAKTAAPKQPAAAGVVCLKVTLRNIKPPVWRRILLPGDMTLGDLHLAIQAVMGWEGYHLHAFDIDGERYGDPTTMDEMMSEQRLTLNGVAKSGVTRFRYTYDFGDDWDHDILIEKTPPAHNATAAPACIGGKHNCPPEDCGGPWGYSDMLDILSNPDHPEYAERREWLGDDFDPERFSVAEANMALAETFRREEPATD